MIADLALCDPPTSLTQDSRDLTSTSSGPASQLLQSLLASRLICPKDWERLSGSLREKLRCHTDRRELLIQLVEQKLLTEYQADRIGVGTTFGLILGNYRVLDRLGGGGMGVAPGPPRGWPQFVQNRAPSDSEAPQDEQKVM